MPILPNRTWLLAMAVALAGCSEVDESKTEAKVNAQLEAGNLQAALVEAKGLLQERPDSGRGRFLLGSLLLAAGDAAGARQELNRALEAGHDEGLVLPELGRAWLAQNKPGEAVAALSAASVADARHACEIAEVLARAHLQTGDTAQAGAALDRARDRAPDDPVCLVAQARLARGQENAGAALARAAALAGRFPDNPSVLVLLADALTDAGHQAAARAAYERVLQVAPRQAGAHAALVQAALVQGDTAAARERVQRMAQALPGQAQTAYMQAMVAYFGGDFAAARERTQQLLRTGSNYVPLLVLAGMTERRLGAAAQAEALLGKAMSLVPDAVEPRRELAALLVEQGHGQRALDTLKPALDKRTGDAGTWAVAGQAYTLVGKFKAADTAFLRARQKGPLDLQLRLGYARSLLARGQDERGLRELSALAAQDRGGESDLALVSALMQRKDSAGALKAVERLAQKSPKLPLVAVLRGQIQEQRGQPGPARQAYEDALSLDPDFLPAVERLATLDMAQQKPEEASARYRALLKRKPREARAMLALAEISRYSAGRQAAGEWLDKAVSVNPADPAPWIAAVQMERGMGEGAAALNRARRAAAALPDDFDIQRQLALALQDSGDANQAMTVLQRLATLRPTSAEPRLRLAEAHLNAGSLPQARQQLDRAVALEPASPEVLRAQTLLFLREGQPAKALAVARARQQMAPLDPQAWLQEAQVQAFMKDWPAAAAVLRQGLAKTGDSALAGRLADALRNAGQVSEAEEFERSWAATHPQDVEFAAYLGQSADARGAAAEAERWYRRAIELRSDMPVVLNNLAFLLVKSKPAEALKLAQAAVRQAPDVPPFLDTLARAQAATGGTDDAVKTQARAVELAPRSGDFRLELARLLMKTGERRKARDELEQLEKRGAEYARQEEVAKLLAEARR